MAILDGAKCNRRIVCWASQLFSCRHAAAAHHFNHCISMQRQVTQTSHCFSDVWHIFYIIKYSFALAVVCECPPVWRVHVYNFLEHHAMHTNSHDRCTFTINPVNTMQPNIHNTTCQATVMSNCFVKINWKLQYYML